MLDILARSFLTATRVDTPKTPKGAVPKPIVKPRWAAPTHWLQRPRRLTEPDCQ